jgi:perosamine synthetase
VYLLPTCPIDRNDLMQKLLDEGVSTRSGVMTIHRETAYREYCADVSLPASEDVCDRSIILPLYVQMTQEEVRYVIQQVRSMVGK